MIRTSIEKQVDERAWNESVRQSPAGTIFQSTLWADFYREYLEIVLLPRKREWKDGSEG